MEFEWTCDVPTLNCVAYRRRVRRGYNFTYMKYVVVEYTDRMNVIEKSVNESQGDIFVELILMDVLAIEMKCIIGTCKATLKFNTFIYFLQVQCQLYFFVCANITTCCS